MHLAGKFIFHSNSQTFSPRRSTIHLTVLAWLLPAQTGLKCIKQSWGMWLVPHPLGRGRGSLVCQCTPPCWLVHEQDRAAEIRGTFPPPPPKGRAFLVIPWNADSLPWKKFRHVAGQLVCQELFLQQRKAVIRLRATLGPRLASVCLQQCQLKVSGVRWGLVNLHQVIGQSELKILLCLCRKATASYLSSKKGRGPQPISLYLYKWGAIPLCSCSKSLPTAVGTWGLGSISNFYFLL